MYRLLVFVFLCKLALMGFGQSLKIGDWNIHLNYTNINTATSINGMVYIGTQSGLFLYDSGENSITTFSKLDGLNGHNVQSLAHDPTRETMLIGYKDGNIDILKDGIITNLICLIFIYQILLETSPLIPYLLMEIWHISLAHLG